MLGIADYETKVCAGEMINSILCIGDSFLVLTKLLLDVCFLLSFLLLLLSTLGLLSGILKLRKSGLKLLIFCFRSLTELYALCKLDLLIHAKEVNTTDLL